MNRQSSTLGTLLCLSLLTAAAHASQGAAPNIILIVTDDQGWTDTSLRMSPDHPGSGSDYYRTPNIERLAQTGMRFSNAYSPSPICSPTRISMLTGKSPQQLHLTDIIDAEPGTKRFIDYYAGAALVPPLSVFGIADGEVTIAEQIKRFQPAYGTAHFGKWHLAGGGPGRHGFDVHDGSTGNGNTGGALLPDPNPKDVFGMTDRAIDYVRRQVEAGKPFFMQVSHYAPHLPPMAMQSTIERHSTRPKGAKHGNPMYSAMLTDLDTSVGMLLDALEALGIADDTYLFFTSDNGGSEQGLRAPMTDNAPLANGKASVWEGGIRVPLIVAGPDIEAGAVSHTPVIGWDFFPTFCAIAGCPTDRVEGLEGGNLLPLLEGDAVAVDRPRENMLVWHFPHYLGLSGTAPQSAIRIGDYKLIRFFDGGVNKLFDLSEDLGETTDLTSTHREIEQELLGKLIQYLSEVRARIPVYASAALPEPTNTRAVRIHTEPCEDCSRYESRYQGLAHIVPEGWAVKEEGFMTWLAESPEDMPWNRVDGNRRPYIGVGALSRKLNPQDNDQTAASPTPLELTAATYAALKPQHRIDSVSFPRPLEIAGRDAAEMTVSYSGRILQQIIVRVDAERLVVVSGYSTSDHSTEILELIRRIAADISTLPNPAIRPL